MIYLAIHAKATSVMDVLQSSAKIRIKIESVSAASDARRELTMVFRGSRTTVRLPKQPANHLE